MECCFSQSLGRVSGDCGLPWPCRVRDFHSRPARCNPDRDGYAAHPDEFSPGVAGDNMTARSTLFPPPGYPHFFDQPSLAHGQIFILSARDCPARNVNTPISELFWSPLAWVGMAASGRDRPRPGSKLDRTRHNYVLLSIARMCLATDSRRTVAFFRYVSNSASTRYSRSLPDQRFFKLAWQITLVQLISHPYLILHTPKSPERCHKMARILQ